MQKKCLLTIDGIIIIVRGTDERGDFWWLSKRAASASSTIRMYGDKYLTNQTESIPQRPEGNFEVCKRKD